MASVEYHRKVRDLIASMQDSERHRLELERKLIGHLKSTKRLERLQARRLMDYWRRLREDETRSRDRNERTLRRLEEAEAHAAVLAARTESLRLAKAQYEESVSRMYPGWRAIVARRTAEERRRELERDEAYEGFRTYLLDGRPPAADGVNSGGGVVSPGQTAARDASETIAYPPPPSPQKSPHDVTNRSHRRRNSEPQSAADGAVRLEAAAIAPGESGVVGGRGGGGAARWPQELGATTTFAQEVADDSLKFGKARHGKPACQSPLPQPVSYQHEALAKAPQGSRGGQATASSGGATYGVSSASDDDEAASVGLGRSPGPAAGAAAEAGARHGRRSSGAAIRADGSSSAAPPAAAAAQNARQHKADAQPKHEKLSIGSSFDAVSHDEGAATWVVQPEHEFDEVRDRRQLSGVATSTPTSRGTAVAATLEAPKQVVLPDSHVIASSAKAGAHYVVTSGDDKRLVTGDKRDDSAGVEHRSHSAAALTDSWSYDETLSSTSDAAPRSPTAAPTAASKAGPAAAASAAAAAAGTVLQVSAIGDELATDSDMSTSSAASHDVSKTEPTRGGADGESAGAAAAAGGGGAPAVAFDFGRTHVIDDHARAHGGDPESVDELSKSAAQNSTLSERSRGDDDDDDEANHVESFGSIAETDAYQSLLKGSLPLKPTEPNENESDTSSVDSVEAVERQMKSIYDKGTLTAAPSVDDPDADVKGSAAAAAAADEDGEDRNDYVTPMGYSSATTAFKDGRRGASEFGTSTADGASRTAQPISGAANSIQTTATVTSTGANSTGTGATPRFSASIRIATLRGSDTESETDDHEQQQDAIRSSAAIKNSTPTFDDDDFDFYG